MTRSSQGLSVVRSKSGKAEGASAGSTSHVNRKSRSALVRSIADALVIKDQDVYFLCERDGRVPLKGKHGCGLYYHDCRFLNGYTLTVAGKGLTALTANAGGGFKAELELTNLDTRPDDVRPL